MVVLSPRQYDIYKAKKEDINSSITPEEIVRDYPSTSQQPRKKKKSKSKTKRKKKGCGCK